LQSGIGREKESYNWCEYLGRCQVPQRTHVMSSFHARLVASPLVVLAALLVVPTANCDEPVSPSIVEMSADRLRRITTEAEHQVDKGNLVGMVSLVARRGKIVYLDAVGHQNRAKNIPMRTDTIFRVASMTKPVTSLAILMLYEEGKIQLTDPLSKYVREFSEMKVIRPDGQLEEAEREIAIYDLLTHNSGLAYHDHSLVGHYYHEADITCGRGLTLYRHLLAALRENPLTASSVFSPVDYTTFLSSIQR
jgi:CubicO group peptidase (beta-lactamase class C family)